MNSLFFIQVGYYFLLLCVNENNDRCKKGKKQLTNWNGYSIIPFVRRKHQSGQHNKREWLRGGASPCQGEGRGFESRLALFLFASEICQMAGFRSFSLSFFFLFSLFADTIDYNKTVKAQIFL